MDDNIFSLINKVSDGRLRLSPWLVVLPLLAITIFFLSGALFQTIAERDKLMATAMSPHHFIVHDPQNGPFCLYVAHPLKLLLGDPVDVTGPVAIGLTPLTLVVSRTVPVWTTIYNTFPIPRDVYTIYCDKISEVLTPTNGFVKNTGLTTYAVTVDTGPNLTIVGGNGDLPLPTALYDLGFSASPAGSMQIVHIRQSEPALWWHSPAEVNIAVAERGGGKPLIQETLSIQQESLAEGLIRSIYIGFRGDSIAIAIAVVPIYGTIATALFLSRRARRRKIAEHRAQIDALPLFRKKSYVKFLEECKKISNLISIPGAAEESGEHWDSPEVSSYFKKTKGATISAEFDRFIRLLEADKRGEAYFRNELKAIQSDEGEKWLELYTKSMELVYASDNFDTDHKLKADALKEKIQSVDSEKNGSESSDLWSSSSLLFAWPSTVSFWRKSPQTFTLNKTSRLNVFADNRAEKDSFLFPSDQKSRFGRKVLTWQQPKLRPDWYNNLAERARVEDSVFVTGDSGSGKTAAALMLARDISVGRLISFRSINPTSAGDQASQYHRSLPIYWPCQTEWDTSNQQLQHFLAAYARTLLSHLRLFPDHFLESSSREQNAIAYLFRTVFGTGKRIRFLASQFHMGNSLDPDSALNPLVEMIDEVDNSEYPLDLHENDWLLTILYNSFPDSMRRCFALIDVQLTSIENGGNKFGDALWELVGKLNDIDMTSIVFSPSAIALQVSEQSIVKTKWQDLELRHLLQDRLLQIDNTQNGSIGTLCDPRDMDNIVETENKLIKASDSSPGKLIGIGNQFVRAIGKKGGSPLGQLEVDAILTPLTEAETAA